MTFAEADAQYELVKQRYQAGALTDEQYDDQLRALMVLDDQGRWWAKSRENGAWHYYDAVTGDWRPGTLPAAPPSLAPPAAASPTAASTASTASTPPRAMSGGAVGDSGSGALPKWAAVAPATVQPPATGSAGQGAPASSTPATPATATPATVAGYSARDFAPLPELRGSLKIIFFVLSLVIPILGIIFYFVYRSKPAPSDRSAARAFLILGVISLVLFGLCSVGVALMETMILGA